MFRWSSNAGQLVCLWETTRIVHGRAGRARRSSLAAPQQHPTSTRKFSSAREESGSDSTGIAAPAQVIPPKKGRLRRVLNSITTLDPERLDDRSLLDVSGRIQANIYLDQLPGEVRFQPLWKLRYCFADGKVMRFPPHTKGYLYFHGDRHRPLASEIRFRVANSSDPTSFATGHDLIVPDGSVWCRHLWSIASDPSTALSRHLLVRDGLVTEEHFSNYQEVPAPTGVHIRQPITRLGQPFILDFARHVNQKITLRSQSQDKPRAGTMYLPLRYGPKRQPRIGYYQDGIALCRFERSTLPEHAGKRMVVMRYVKILRPVKLVSWSSQLRRVNASLPVEGELCEKHGRVWAKDVDADTQEARTFRGLYEADEQESTQS